ncbi:hypothetical protein CCACVL1_03238 [Corchorus capsularis]|uniref:Uncharacterized protein n=1 Tax=Corchorus capsularis TaxID=210143 RepID=A0A1R3K1I0_COCAP|nr:hypothetical protein CCACVL1_03238 [Corchorus capsularis]
MGSEAEYFEETAYSNTPKLSLYSFPSKAKESPAPGVTTSPIHSSVSIPFQWEEAPGKPRLPCPAGSDISSTPRCLELPPRLLAEAKVANMPSPTTVLDGPDHASRSVSYTFSFRKGGSFRSPDNNNNNNNNRKVLFGSSRWGSFRKPGRVVQGSFDLSSIPIVDGADSNGGGGGGSNGGDTDTQVKITRFRRKGSLLSHSQARSHVFASIYESFKQVVPWRRGHEKLKKKAS